MKLIGKIDYRFFIKLDAHGRIASAIFKADSQDAVSGRFFVPILFLIKYKKRGSHITEVSKSNRNSIHISTYTRDSGNKMKGWRKALLLCGTTKTSIDMDQKLNPSPFPSNLI